MVVSDLDDTIKITNSGNEVDGAINAALTNKVFTGMPEFLQELSAYTQSLHILSASPTLLRRKIEKNLALHHIDYRELRLRNLLTEKVKLDYKVKYLIKLFQDNPHAQFILIGDDVGQDPEAYDEMMRHYPGRVVASYIHMIKNRSIASSHIKYWHSADLYLREYQGGRMGSSAVVQALRELMEETDMTLIIPDFAHCPKTPLVWSWQILTPFAQEAHAVAAKVNAHCRSKLIVPLY